MGNAISNNKVIIQRQDLLSSIAQELIAALNAELSALYPEEGANHFRLDPEEVRAGNGTFLVATLDGSPVGCGALRRIGTCWGELKRMYVAPSARGLGVGKALLAALEIEARTMRLTRILLETGIRQTEALRLYRNAGFLDIPAYGEYLDSPLSVCMAKELPSTNYS